MRTFTDKYAEGCHHLQQPLTIQTTLYELIETVIDVVGPDKNKMIMAVLLDTLRKGRSNVKVSGTITN